MESKETIIEKNCVFPSIFFLFVWFLCLSEFEGSERSVSEKYILEHQMPQSTFIEIGPLVAM